MDHSIALNHLSTFSGIGGFDLAAEWMGWNNIAHVEINPFCRKVLNHYWPKSDSYEDIKKTDFTIYRGRVDILTGGFPCQPYSTAGKRKGKEDERHLWPEMLRAIREAAPRWVVGENVRGLVNWNDGLVFDEVQADLEAQGYEVWPYLLPACAVNAPHRRDRIWFVAYSDKCAERPPRPSGEIKSNWGKNNDEQSEWRKQAKQRYECSNVLRADTHANSARRRKSDKKNEEQSSKQFDGHSFQPNDPNTNGDGLQRRRKSNRKKKTKGQIVEFDSLNQRHDWENYPSQSPVCGGNDGLSTELDGITFPKWRNESIKAFGNAIVPQVAHNIFKSINQFEKQWIVRGYY